MHLPGARLPGNDQQRGGQIEWAKPVKESNTGKPMELNLAKLWQIVIFSGLVCAAR